MSMVRKRPSYHYGFDTGGGPSHGHPDTLYPPEGYCLLERDLHRATISLEVQCSGYSTAQAAQPCLRRCRSGAAVPSLLYCKWVIYACPG